MRGRHFNVGDLVHCDPCPLFESLPVGWPGDSTVGKAKRKEEYIVSEKLL